MTQGVPRQALIENARRELRALQQQRTIAEQGMASLSRAAAELTAGDDNDCVILRDAARELETGVIRSLEGDAGIPDRAADLRRIADRLEVALFASTNIERAILAALVALCSIRLTELQTGHANAVERIPLLEGFLKQAESGVVLPGMVMPS